MGRLTLILGGARSGKSRYAQELAAELAKEKGGTVAYLATARPGDEEMKERIEKHRLDRPSDWKTVEATMEISGALLQEGGSCPAVIVDCLTLLINNLLLSDSETGGLVKPGAVQRVATEIGRLIETVRAVDAEVIVVSNEVGLGVVPPSPLGRLFRDIAGQANQRLARAADEVYFMAAGLPQRLKGSAGRR